MNQLVIFFLTLTLFSCDKIASVTTNRYKKNKAQDTINYHHVDKYPQFSNCNELMDYKEGKTCFETSFYQKINSRIQNLSLATNTPVTDTVLIHFSIYKNGTFFCKNIKISDSLQKKLPNLSAELQKIIHGLAPVVPAQKRGVPVISSFTFPLIIETP